MTEVEEVEEIDVKARGGAQYDAKTIQVLKGLEAVRKRPAMYIGDTGSRGLHHLVYEVVDNSVDEALAGYCTQIQVTITKENTIIVEDNGRGIPVDMHPTQKRPALEVVMTMLHAGGKFTHDTYKVSGGLHGVGVSVVNALSEWCKVEVVRDGQRYFQEYAFGNPVADMRVVGKGKHSGTKTHFKPDGRSSRRLISPLTYWRDGCASWRSLIRDCGSILATSAQRKASRSITRGGFWRLCNI